MSERQPSPQDSSPVTHTALILTVSLYELFYAVVTWLRGQPVYAALSLVGLVASLVVAYLVARRRTTLLVVSRVAVPITMLWMVAGLADAARQDGPDDPHLYMTYLILVTFSFATLQLTSAMTISVMAFIPLALISLTRLPVMMPFTQMTMLADVAFLAMLLGFLVVFGRQSAEQRQRTLDYADLALKDGLTGLANRRAVDAVLREWMTPSQKPPGVALVLFDLDHFKSLNDTYGHREGDEALKAVARAMESQCRSGDLLCRWGGEEFLLVLKDVNPQVALDVAHRVQREVSHIVLHVPRRLTLSGGVAMLDEAYSLPELLALADRRLYAAKNAGRNTIFVEGPRFHPHLASESSESSV